VSQSCHRIRATHVELGVVAAGPPHQPAVRRRADPVTKGTGWPMEGAEGHDGSGTKSCSSWPAPPSGRSIGARWCCPSTAPDPWRGSRMPPAPPQLPGGNPPTGRLLPMGRP